MTVERDPMGSLFCHLLRFQKTYELDNQGRQSNTRANK
jgi:hypothetical protein